LGVFQTWGTVPFPNHWLSPLEFVNLFSFLLLGTQNLTMEDLNCWTGSESTDEQQEHDEDAALGHLGRSEKEVCQIKWHFNGTSMAIFLG
jgi:hypothetical protein